MRDAYAPDFLNPLLTHGDELLNSVRGIPTRMTMEDVRQGAAPQDMTAALVQESKLMYDVAVSDAVTPGPTTADPATVAPIAGGPWFPQATTGLMGSVQDFFQRGLFGIVGVVVVAAGLYFIAKD